MIINANAKINIGLYVCEKRPDGYHNLETVFYPIPLYDIIEVVLASARLGSEPEDQFVQTGISIPGEGNICLKALDLFRAETGVSEKLRIHLHKQVPTGAGLGGGSADASFLLKGLDELFGTNLGEEKLMEMALQLGADCPFFILNKPAYAEGLGEQLTKIPLDLQGYTLVLAHNPVHISTAKAFSGIQAQESGVNLRLCMQEPVSFWRNEVKNDFEKTVFKVYPELAELKAWLYQNGAEYAALTGTGSVVYGLFPESVVLEEADGVKLYHLNL